MTKTIRKAKSTFSKMERGQVLIVVAFAIVGIVAIIGLTIDVGVMFIEDARLRKAVDSAALAAALQFREGVPSTQLTDAATEYLLLNGVTLDAQHPVVVHTCADVPSMCFDAAQNTTILRKLVSIHVNATVHLAFLPVIGINTVQISADATGESASLDLVLVLDTSESMTFNAPGPDPTNNPSGDPLRDPTVCNNDSKVAAIDNAMGWGGIDPYDTTNPDHPHGMPINTNDGMPGECHPFEEVKQAAVAFLNKLYFPYDRVAVVSFNKTATTQLQFDENCDLVAHPGGCTSGQILDTITNVIKNLAVFDANGSVCPTGQPCLPYCTQASINNYVCNSDNRGNWIAQNDPNAVYAGNFDCGDGYDINAQPPMDPSQCGTTNLGQALYSAGTAFRGSATSTTAIRTSSLWVVVLLTDGAASTGNYNDAANTPACPANTWDPFRNLPNSAPLCRDISSETRHCADSATEISCVHNGTGDPKPPFQNGVRDANNYDADDSAHDAADYVGITQGATIFSIGLGPLVHNSDEAGYKFLKYAAEYVGNGAYFNASSATDLTAIFKQIGDKIATRLAH